MADYLEVLGVELGLQTSDHRFLSEGPHQMGQVLDQGEVSHCQAPSLSCNQQHTQVRYGRKYSKTLL